MEPIIRAILDSDLSEVRRLISSDAKKAWTKSESGKTPAQLAHSLKNYPLIVAIVRSSPQCMNEIACSPKELLLDLIYDFSQSTLCSSWNQNIEYDLWSLIIQDTKYNRGYDEYLVVDRDLLSDIGWISAWAEGWFHWPDTDESPRFIAMKDWAKRYRGRGKR